MNDAGTQSSGATGKGLLARFRRHQGGATVIEFALVAMPFFLLLMALIEVTTSYFATIQLENGLETVARQIRTGEIQAANLTAAQFKNLLCNNVAPLIPCDANLYVDVRRFDSFGNVAQPMPLNPDGTINPSFQFDPGISGSIVLARAFYVWHVNTPIIGAFLSNMAGGDNLIGAAQVFRNEPWS
jgi:Flp pilus assembly protein TadG